MVPNHEKVPFFMHLCGCAWCTRHNGSDTPRTDSMYLHKKGSAQGKRYHFTLTTDSMAIDSGAPCCTLLRILFYLHTKSISFSSKCSDLPLRHNTDVNHHSNQIKLSNDSKNAAPAMAVSVICNYNNEAAITWFTFKRHVIK